MILIGGTPFSRASDRNELVTVGREPVDLRPARMFTPGVGGYGVIARTDEGDPKYYGDYNEAELEQIRSGARPMPTQVGGHGLNLGFGSGRSTVPRASGQSQIQALLDMLRRGLA